MRKLWPVILIVLLMLSGAVNICLAYQMERPSRDIDPIEGREENATVGDEAAVGIGVEIHNYEENSGPL